jgi:hypothetical protein
MSLIAALLAVSPVMGQTSATQAARADTGAMASVSGTVYDSVTNTLLGGAQVQFVDEANRGIAYTIVADSLGRFHSDSIRPGLYIAGFYHEAVDALGLEPPLTAVTIKAGSDNTVALVIPGPARVLKAMCGPATGDSTGAVAGVVRDADSGLPVAGAKVVMTWLEIVIDKRGLMLEKRRMPALTNENGGYYACGLAGADTILASAEISGRRSGVVNLPIRAYGVVRRDFTLGDSTSAIAFLPDSNASEEVRRETTLLRGSSMLSGTVYGPGKPEEKPMRGAKVTVAGTGLETTTGSDGRFTLNGLPAGTFSVEARSLGFEPRHAVVDLSPRKPASADLTFTERVQELSRVVVKGKASHNVRDIDEFLQRSRSGMGHFITASDDALKNALTLTDALRGTPGVNIVPSGDFGHVILLRGRCIPVLYIDGVQMFDGYNSADSISPEQIAGIEVYAGLGEAPVQYQTNGCGVVLLWTKR